MTVGELRAILENDFIPDEMVPMNYDDQSVKEVIVTIDKDGDVAEVRLSMSS
jgi:hypothetical protein